MLAVAVGLAMSVVFSASAASASAAVQTEAPAAEATWDLSNYEQRICIWANGSYSTYFVGFIAGSWDAPLLTEVHGMPEGTELYLPPPIPPGDNGDQYIGTIWFGVDLPPLDYGEYPAELVVTDGTVTQTMPIMIKAQDDWGC
ncbi:DUF5980 family protein [Glycomyces arizonensis]|uniref:DUF5980 family protein n=1 Tax=Glycomyces arizonensis TaxID=256035 RepID=UPI00042A7E65|nr:DUF5980 family protein [Glycomyces arizonensis]